MVDLSLPVPMTMIAIQSMLRTDLPSINEPSHGLQHLHSVFSSTAVALNPCTTCISQGWVTVGTCGAVRRAALLEGVASRLFVSKPG